MKRSKYDEAKKSLVEVRKLLPKRSPPPSKDVAEACWQAHLRRKADTTPAFWTASPRKAKVTRPRVGDQVEILPGPFWWLNGRVGQVVAVDGTQVQLRVEGFGGRFTMQAARVAPVRRQAKRREALAG